MGEIRADNLEIRNTPGMIPASSDDLQRIGYIPMNSVDSLVRHAPSLQQTADTADGLAHINRKNGEQTGSAAPAGHQPYHAGITACRCRYGLMTRLRTTVF